jgi:hypothetical protein
MTCACVSKHARVNKKTYALIFYACTTTNTLMRKKITDANEKKYTGAFEKITYAFF